MLAAEAGYSRHSRDPRQGARAGSALFLVSAVLAAASTPVAAQTTRHVALCGNDAWSGLSSVCAAPAGPKRTIQAAINASVSGDTVLVADGTYTGPGNRDIDFGGRDITVKSVGGAAACILDAQATAQDQHRLFHFHSGESPQARLDGFTIRGGAVDQQRSPADRGAGIAIEHSSPTIANCSIVSNGLMYVSSGATDAGGGVATEGGNPTFLNCAFTDNEATSRGGGAAIFGNATFVGCEFNNSAPGTSFYGGGGSIYVEAGRVDLIGCSIAGWAGRAGGGLYLLDAVATITNCIIDTNNINADWGAGLAAENSTIVAVGSLFRNNKALMQGGALRLVGGSCELKRCRLLGNSAIAGGSGGAIHCSAGQLSLSECLIAGNNGTSGSAIFAQNTSVTIRGCTIANNGFGGSSALWLPPSAVIANSIIWGNSGTQLSGPSTIMYSAIQGGYTGIGNLASDPMFLNPAGLTLVAANFALRPGSPCIDRGSNPQVTPGVTLDLVGNPRFLDDPWSPDIGIGPAPVADMGAFEFAGVSCYADCNANGVLGVGDFACFQNKFVAQDTYCDCNGDGARTIADFACFQSKFVQGCP